MEYVDLHPVTARPPLGSIAALEPGEKPIIVSYVDWLVTSLVHAAPAELTAELGPEAKSVMWHLLRLDSNGPAIVIDTVHERFFRAILSRLAFGYMGGHPYGGYRHFYLRAPASKHRLVFHLANDSLDGFWFRGRCSSGTPHEQRAGAE